MTKDRLQNDILFLKKNETNYVMKRNTKEKYNRLYKMDPYTLIYGSEENYSIEEECYAYQLPSEPVFAMDNDGNKHKMNCLSLTSIYQIIQELERNRKVNYKRIKVCFISEEDIILPDKMTISLLEYLVYLYRKQYKIQVVILPLKFLKMEVDNKYGFYDIFDEKKMTLAGYCLDTSQGALFASPLTSPLLSGVSKNNWGRDYYDKMFFTELEVAEQKQLRIDSYSPGEGFRRMRRIYEGETGASRACDDCEEFLNYYNLNEKDIDSVISLLYELIPNALEHGGGDCLLDIDACPVWEDESKRNVQFNLVIFDFSNKLIWSDIVKKLEDSDTKKYVHQGALLRYSKEALNYHKSRFSNDYTRDDFNNVLSFQKISGRKGDRESGGKGLSIVVNTLLKNTCFNICGMISGKNGIIFKQEYLNRNEEGFLGFNETNNFLTDIPNIRECIDHEKLYFPGVAYNFSFIFKKEF